jgi:hypothetical protein
MVRFMPFTSEVELSHEGSGSNLTEMFHLPSCSWRLGVFLAQKFALRQGRTREPLLAPSALKDQIEDLIAANVKAECLKS